MTAALALLGVCHVVTASVSARDTVMSVVHSATSAGFLRKAGVPDLAALRERLLLGGLVRGG
jgi:hypothetical protein